MTKIPIKIKPDLKTNHQDIKKALNLNQVFVSASQVTKKSLFWPGLAAILFLISFILAAQLFWLKPDSVWPYQKFIPSQTKAVIFLKTSQLKDLAMPFLPELELNFPFWRWLKDRLSQFLSETGLSPEKDLAPLLKEEVAFLVISANSQKLNWGIIAQTKPDQSQQKQIIFEKIEQGLRKDFGLNQLFYRQIKITSVYSFNQIDRPYFYAQVNNFLVISNDLTGLQALLDRIIGG